jgi:hypothetical protein
MDRLGAGRGERGRSLLRAGEAEDLMAVRDQFADDSGADEAGRSRDKDAHVRISQSD